jgi:chaperonin GroEL
MTRGGLRLPDADTLALEHEPIVGAPRAPIPAELTTRFRVRRSSRYFTSDPQTNHTVLWDAIFIVTRSPLDAHEPLIAVLEVIAREQICVVVAAPRVSRSALALLVCNRLRGIIHACAVDADDETLGDIATKVGSMTFGPLDTVDVAGLRRVDRVIVTDDELALSAE